MDNLEQIRQALSEWRGEQRDELAAALSELLDTCEARHVDLRLRDDGHPAWCELDPDHRGRCHTAECGYGHRHQGLCWFVPTWPERGDFRFIPDPYARGRGLDLNRKPLSDDEYNVTLTHAEYRGLYKAGVEARGRWPEDAEWGGETLLSALGKLWQARHRTGDVYPLEAKHKAVYRGEVQEHQDAGYHPEDWEALP